MKVQLITEAYEAAREYYATLGIDAEAALATLTTPPPSCPFEGRDGSVSLVEWVTNVRQQQQRQLLAALGGDEAGLGSVYDEYCRRCDVPVGDEYIADCERFASND